MQTIGERLEEARKRKGLSIREAAEATKIRSEYLHKFESNSFDVNLPEIYARGFLRAYAAFLKLPAEKIITDYSALGLANEPKSGRRDLREVYGRMDLSAQAAAAAEEPKPAAEPAQAAPPAAPAPRPFPSRALPVSRGPVLDTALLVKSGIIAVVAVILIIVLVWSIKAITSGPSAAARAAAAQTAAAQAPAANPVLTLIASDNVHVKVVQEADQKVIFEGDLARGESRTIPRPGNLIVTASDRNAVQFEINGRRYAIPPGYNSVRLH